MIGRIPVLSVTPVVECARYPAKAAVGEPFDITALVFREGHDALGAGVVINGLAILCRPPCSGRPRFEDLEAEYAEQIIGGPGAFVVTADGSESFAQAVRRKLILEIAGLGDAAGRPRREPGIRLRPKG